MARQPILQILLLSTVLCIGGTCVKAQEVGHLTGLLQSQINIFLEDEKIGATNTPQYDDQIFGSDNWLELNYHIKGYDMGIRIDGFKNSNLLNPRDSYSALGVGKWYVQKRFNRISAEIGYVYDQIGSGIIFRSYEERPLLIDNGLLGGLIRYEGNNWSLKGFAGRPKNLFKTYDSVITGAELDGVLQLGREKKVTLVPGVGFLVKAKSQEQVDNLVETVRDYTPNDSIGLFYRSHAITLYNTLSYGSFTMYTEYALKSNDTYFDPDGIRQLRNGATTLGRFKSDPGSVFYSSIAWGTKGFGSTFEYKRTRNFTFRADPFTSLNRGLLNYLPPMSRINSYRLKSRYVPATREIAEQAFQLELRYSVNKKWKLEQYLSYITDLDQKLLYRELDHQVQFRQSSQNIVTFGLQLQHYNQAIYEGKTGQPPVKTITPYLEWFKRLSRKKSLKIESQYMNSQQDFGSWLFLLAEYSIAPKWSFAASDMYNVKPLKTNDLHYPRFDVVYSVKTNRFGLSFIKQVEGIVCAGGICRLEPAFSGVKFTFNKTF